MSNLIITLVGLGSVVYLMKSDVRHGSAMLRRNMKTIRTWLEEEGATVAKSGCAARQMAASARPAAGTQRDAPDARTRAGL